PMGTAPVRKNRFLSKTGKNGLDILPVFTLPYTRRLQVTPAVLCLIGQGITVAAYCIILEHRCQKLNDFTYLLERRSADVCDETKRLGGSHLRQHVFRKIGRAHSPYPPCHLWEFVCPCV